jgi:hypothetical protein
LFSVSDSRCDSVLKYAATARASSSVIGKLGMRISTFFPAGGLSSGRSGSTCLRKLNSHACWILFPSPRRLGGARVAITSAAKNWWTDGLLPSIW